MQTADKTSYHKTKSENAQHQPSHNKEVKHQTQNGECNNHDPCHVVKDESH